MSSKPAVPATIGKAGSALWQGIVKDYDLRPDELITLEDACALTDMIDALEQAWVEEGKPLTARGSTGQLVTHPTIGTLHQHRMARTQLLRSLKLPEDGDAERDAGERSSQARAAANARWSRRGA